MQKNAKELTREDIFALTDKCWNGEPAPCSRACPFKLEVRGFIDKAARGRWQAAFKAYRDAVVFPELVSLLCPAYCESNCARSTCGGSIDLRGIERAAVSFTKDRRAAQYALPPRTEKIAVIGAGVAGLSAALLLSQKKYPVTVFEADTAWGGALRGSEHFDVIDREFASSFASSGVDFRFGTRVASVDELSGYDACYFATGSDDLRLTGSDFDIGNLWKTDTNIFAGGGILGHDAMLSIADGKQVTLAIETYLQTGRPSAPQVTLGGCEHAPSTADTPVSGRVLPADGAFCTEEEAKSEAERCLRCDCTDCMDGCEMLKRFRKLPRKISTEVYSDTRANPPYSSHTITREAYACNDCGYCASICSEAVNTGEVLRLSRRSRNALGHNPPAFHDFWLREMEFSNSDASLRFAGADGATCQYVFFPGCQLGAYRPEHVYKTFELLRSNCDIGIYLGCCGAPAFWSGDDSRLAKNTDEIISFWNASGKPTFVYACVTCRRMLREVAPEIECVSVYELLKTARVADCDCEFSVFDPCSARDDPTSFAAVRDLLKTSGATVRELEDKFRCCGYGGLISVANPALFDEITGSRVAASDLPYITYCANCNAVFSRRGKDSAHILDVVLGLGRQPVPDIETRRGNSLVTARKVAAALGISAPVPAGNPWDAVEIEIDDELFERCDRKLISLSDLREAIHRAETGKAFFSDGDGSRTASMVTAALVYWVVYRPLGGNKFVVTDAYTHRMKFDGGEAV